MKLILTDKGDPSVGIFETTWEVDVPLQDFKDAKMELDYVQELQFFKESIKKVYEEFAEGRIIAHYDFEIEIMNHNEQAKLNDPNKTKVKLTKLKESDNPRHANNIEVGFEKTGKFIAPPQVGKPFWIDTYWATSNVTEIIDEKTFRTLNSIYTYETWEE